MEHKIHRVQKEHSRTPEELSAVCKAHKKSGGPSAAVVDVQGEQELSTVQGPRSICGCTSTVAPLVHVNQQPTQAQEPLHRRRGRRSGRFCRRSCCWWTGTFCITSAGMAIVLGIVSVVAYLLLKPKAPSFLVSDASITAFSLSSQPIIPADAIPEVPIYLNADVTFHVTAENPNKKIGIYYEKVDVMLFYQDEKIGEGSIPPFFQGHENITFLLLHMVGKDVALTPTIGNALQTTLNNATSTISLSARTMAAVSIKIGSWKSGSWKFAINCKVKLDNPTALDPRLMSKSCALKVSSISI
ncbi:hypothetical protein KP509_09G050300 [Ceratopteris richardii]|uniref:Late embryogenesis abundant protein LEA-2 subgroup domain-containing protein n=1 Tax=Ceratopteris richardii TaxID=49495 RepID=A0A8T2UAD5_CERRI|nr:hypothetical protein KP509_09G050300 [Ceratopteris richardii]